MSDAEIRVAIAEKCGWNHWFNGWNRLDDNTPPLTLTQDLPDYPNDLNACHEFEEALDAAQCRSYNEILVKLCIPIKSLFPPFPEKRAEQYLFHATARQRCEAFLRVHGLWKDNPTPEMSETE